MILNGPDMIGLAGRSETTAPWPDNVAPKRLFTKKGLAAQTN